MKKMIQFTDRKEEAVLKELEKLEVPENMLIKAQINPEKMRTT